MQRWRLIEKNKREEHIIVPHIKGIRIGDDKEDSNELLQDDDSTAYGAGSEPILKEVAVKVVSTYRYKMST